MSRSLFYSICYIFCLLIVSNWFKCEKSGFSVSTQLNSGIFAMYVCLSLECELSRASFLQPSTAELPCSCCWISFGLLRKEASSFFFLSPPSSLHSSRDLTQYMLSPLLILRHLQSISQHGLSLSSDRRNVHLSKVVWEFQCHAQQKVLLISLFQC